MLKSAELAHEKDPFTGAGLPTPTWLSTVRIWVLFLIFHHALPCISPQGFFDLLWSDTFSPELGKKKKDKVGSGLETWFLAIFTSFSSFTSLIGSDRFVDKGEGKLTNVTPLMCATCFWVRCVSEYWQHCGIIIYCLDFVMETIELEEAKSVFQTT